MNQLRVASVSLELQSDDSVASLLSRIDAVIDPIRADVIVLPEFLSFSLVPASQADDVTPEQVLELTSVSSEIQEYFAAKAIAMNTAILGGSLPVLYNHLIKNVATLYLPDGSQMAHAKTHLFPGEHAYGIAEGDRIEVVTFRGFAMSIAICYEVEIPEVITAHKNRGTDLLLVPSFTSSQAGANRVHKCAAARAIENQMFVACAPATGVMFDPVGPAFGSACVLSPCDIGFPDDGILAIGLPDQTDVAVAVVDLELLNTARREGNAITVADRARRASLYLSW
jgi:predicted amidohydrolase